MQNRISAGPSSSDHRLVLRRTRPARSASSIRLPFTSPRPVASLLTESALVSFRVDVIRVWGLLRVGTSFEGRRFGASLDSSRENWE